MGARETSGGTGDKSGEERPSSTTGVGESRHRSLRNTGPIAGGACLCMLTSAGRESAHIRGASPRDKHHSKCVRKIRA